LAYLDSKQITDVGFKSVGRNVLISNKASFYGADKISIGDNVRIDDFCIFSATNGLFNIGNYIHIAAYTSIIGAGSVDLLDFCNISSRVSIYSSSDDYSGISMTNPMVPAIYKNVHSASVLIGKHVIIGCGSVILPGVQIDAGSAIGALSLVNKNCDASKIYAGVPIRCIGQRNSELLHLEKKFLSNISG